MMHLKMNKLKFIIKTSLFLVLAFGLSPFCSAQQTTEKNNVGAVDDTAASAQETIKSDRIASNVAGTNVQMGTNNDSIGVSTETVQDSVSFERFKIDGVAAVIGDRLILNSDIQKMYKDLESQDIPTAGITDCELAERLMKNKLYAHQAIQDSLVINEDRIRDKIDEQIAFFVSKLGSMEKLLEFYNMDNEADLEAELFEINKEQKLSQAMQNKIIEDIEITPEEVREYFEKIPKGERPKFGDEVEIAQIVIEPEVPEEQIEKTIARLNEFRDEILSGQSTFATKAVLYSDDGGSSSVGGKMTISRNSRVVQEFKDAAFSMEEGEISKPFKTEFGYHILMVEKIRGQELDIRHILLIPELSDKTIEKARTEIDSIRKLIVTNEISFSDAARKFSDQKETSGDGGKLINSSTGDTRFEQTNLPPDIYSQVVDLKEGKISGVLTDSDRTGNVFFKIITVLNRYPAHIANYEQDFLKIKELALTEKKLDVIDEWREEKIKNTYIKINGKYRNCDFSENWLMK